MDAVLDRDFSRRPDDHFSGDLRRGRGRWGDRVSPLCPYHLPAACEPLFDLYSALDAVGTRRFHYRFSRFEWWAGIVDRSARYTWLSLRFRYRKSGAWRCRGNVS